VKSRSKTSGKSVVRWHCGFGAALHGWGFTLNMAKEKGVKFSDIVKAYERGEGAKLQKIMPVYEAILKW